MIAMYKMYTGVLTARLMKEVEEKGTIPPNQVGFKKGLRTMDNIYILNYVINRQVKRKGGKLKALLIDFKAVFDSVDREMLMRVLEERGIRKDLRDRVEEMLRETKSRVRIEREVGENFWTAKGVRQGCPLSLILFNLLMADLGEGKTRKNQNRGGGEDVSAGVSR